MKTSMFLLIFALTIAASSPLCAQYAPPPMAPPACVTQTWQGPDGRIQLCTTCFDQYGRPLWTRCT
jgi:hypothetical protein